MSNIISYDVVIIQMQLHFMLLLCDEIEGKWIVQIHNEMNAPCVIHLADKQVCESYLILINR